MPQLPPHLHPRRFRHRQRRGDAVGEVVVVGVLPHTGGAHPVRDGPDALRGLAQVLLKDHLLVVGHAEIVGR